MSGKFVAEQIAKLHSKCGQCTALERHYDNYYAYCIIQFICHATPPNSSFDSSNQSKSSTNVLVKALKLWCQFVSCLSYNFRNELNEIFWRRVVNETGLSSGIHLKYDVSDSRLQSRLCVWYTFVCGSIWRLISFLRSIHTTLNSFSCTNFMHSFNLFNWFCLRDFHFKSIGFLVRKSEL